MRLWFAAITLIGAGLARADELTPKTVSAVQREQQKAQEKLDAAHGNRLPSQMSSEERRQYIEEQQQARQSILEKHGLDDKSYSRYEATLSKEDRAQVQTEHERLLKQDQAQPDQAAPPTSGKGKEITIPPGGKDAAAPEPTHRGVRPAHRPHHPKRRGSDF